MAFAAEKIRSLPELIKIIAGWRLRGKTFSLIFGDFDGLRKTDIDSINRAAGTADYLLVAVQSDQQIATEQRSATLLEKEADRGLVIANLAFVDAVTFYAAKDILPLVGSLQPDVFIKPVTEDYPQKEADSAIAAYGGQILV